MIRRRIRRYGPYEQFLNTACWEISAAGVDEVGDGHLVGPRDGLVVEDVVEPAAARRTGPRASRPGLHAEVGGDHVQQVGVADLVLGLGQHGHLAPQAGRLGDPVPLGQPAHQLRVGVQLDEPEHGGGTRRACRRRARRCRRRRGTPRTLDIAFQGSGVRPLLGHCCTTTLFYVLAHESGGQRDRLVLRRRRLPARLVAVRRRPQGRRYVS